MTNQEAIVYLEGQWDCMCSEDCQIYTGHKDCPQGFICTDGQALLTAISALQAQDSPKPTAESVQNVQNEDLILRKAAIDAIKKYMGDYELSRTMQQVMLLLPSAQPTLCGYDIEHLILIADVLKKENLSPERITEALTDIGRIVSIVRDEFEESLRKAVEQCEI